MIRVCAPGAPEHREHNTTCDLYRTETKMKSQAYGKTNPFASERLFFLCVFVVRVLGCVRCRYCQIINDRCHTSQMTNERI